MNIKQNLAPSPEESHPQAPRPAAETSCKGVFALCGATEKVTGELRMRATGPLARELSIAFADKASGKPIVQFDEELQHELHVLGTDSDFSSFLHEHAAKLGHDGRFRVALQFPKPGTYHVYADAVPTGMGQQVVRFEVQVDTEGGPAGPGQGPAGAAGHSAGPYTVELDTSALRPGVESMMALTILKDGKPAPDLEPYIGVPAHAVFVNTSDLGYVHAHAMPAHDSGGGHGAHASHDDPSAAVPARLILHAMLPAAGRYALWIQFNGGGQVRTVPISLTVQAGPESR